LFEDTAEINLICELNSDGGRAFEAGRLANAKAEGYIIEMSLTDATLSVQEKLNLDEFK